MAPAISPLEYLSSKILVPPWTITAAASWRERSSSACQDTPTASATCAPETSAADKVCDFIDRSTIQGVAPARVSTSAMKRASLLFVSIVARTAMIGLDSMINVPFFAPAPDDTTVLSPVDRRDVLFDLVAWVGTSHLTGTFVTQSSTTPLFRHGTG